MSATAYAFGVGGGLVAMIMAALIIYAASRRHWDAVFVLGLFEIIAIPVATYGIAQILGARA